MDSECPDDHRYVVITLNWKGKGDKKSFEVLNVCSIVKGKNISLTNLLLFESLHLYKTCKADLSSMECQKSNKTCAI
jgi:hypothetical protein